MIRPPTPDHRPTVADIQAAFGRHHRVDPDTSFFDAGFSSATLVEVLAALRGLGLDLTLTTLYRYPTVRQLAAALGIARAAAGPPWAAHDEGRGEEAT